MPEKTFMFTRTVLIDASTAQEAREDLAWLLSVEGPNTEDWSCDIVEDQPEDAVDEL